jgi:hypothetical protein
MPKGYRQLLLHELSKSLIKNKDNVWYV